jgi:hypothetical protein
MSGLFVLFMIFGSITPKFLGMKAATDAMITLGWDTRYMLMIGLLEFGCVLLYLVPHTSIVGAVLMTALLGGAIASQLRADQPLLTHVLFGVYLGILMWGGLWLRDASLRNFILLRLA